MSHPARFGVQASDDFLVSLLKTGLKSDARRIYVSDGIPADSVVVGVSRDGECGSVTVWFKSPSGVEDSEGLPAPLLPITITRADAPDWSKP